MGSRLDGKLYNMYVYIYILGAMNESRDTPPPLMKRSPEIERLWRTNGYLAFVQTRETHAIAEGRVGQGEGEKKECDPWERRTRSTHSAELLRQTRCKRK